MKSALSLSEKPWLFTILFSLSWVICNILIVIALILIFQLESGAQIPSPWTPVLTHILTIFVVAPFVLGFPNKGQTYSDYLSDIHLLKMQPLLGLIILGLSCYLILALSQVAGVLVYSLTQG